MPDHHAYPGGRVGSMAVDTPQFPPPIYLPFFPIITTVHKTDKRHSFTFVSWYSAYTTFLDIKNHSHYSINIFYSVDISHSTHSRKLIEQTHIPDFREPFSQSWYFRGFPSLCYDYGCCRQHICHKFLITTTYTTLKIK